MIRQNPRTPTIIQRASSRDSKRAVLGRMDGENEGREDGRSDSSVGWWLGTVVGEKLWGVDGFALGEMVGRKVALGLDVGE